GGWRHRLRREQWRGDHHHRLGRARRTAGRLAAVRDQQPDLTMNPPSLSRSSAAPALRMAGLSMVALMVAVTISTLLLMGVVALFVSSRASYETTERMSRIQENGRYALDQFANDIRAAGYQGCSRASGTRAQDYAINTVSIDPSDMLWNFIVPAQGFQSLGDG